VLGELAVLAPNGFEEEHGDGYVEYAIYGAEGELPDLGQIEAATGEGTVEVDATEVPDDWADRWQDFHQPLLVSDRVWVRPSWAEPHPEAIDVVIDPGRAFGTGAHATTKLSLALLVDLPARGGLVDVGSGSGVLAIAAAKLGFAPVRALDNDPLAVAATAANAAANGVAVQTARADLRADPVPVAGTVTANLLRPLLLIVAERLTDPPPRALIASGLLVEECDEVASAFAARGLREDARRTEGEWAALRLRSA